MKSKLLFLLGVFAAISMTGVFCNDSFAMGTDGEAEDVICVGNGCSFAGGDGPGFGGNSTGKGTWSSRTGATWAYFTYTGGSGDVIIKPPSGTSTRTATIPDKCRSYGGFFVLLVNEYISGSGYTGSSWGAAKLKDIYGWGGYIRYVPGKLSSGKLFVPNDVKLVSSNYSMDEVERLYSQLDSSKGNDAYWENGADFRFASDSELTGFCWGESIPSTDQVYSSSSVTVNGATKTSNLDSETFMVVASSAINSGTTATFRHKIVSDREPSSGLSGININWSISESYASSNNPPNGRLSLSSGGWTKRADGRWEIVVSTSGAVPVGSGNVCQTITYNPKYYNFAGASLSTSGGARSRACVRVSIVAIDTPSCATLGGVSTKGINYGDTNGVAKVKNANNISGDTGWLSTVWARPGDTVSFAHCFSWGVQAVRKSDSYGGGRSTPSEASSLSDRVGESFFTVSSSRGSQYLFGVRRDQGSIGRTVTLQRFTPTAYRLGGGYINAEANGNYELVLMSPSKELADVNRYNCLIFDFTQFVNYGFQIPGFESWRGSCAASNATGRTNEVGTTISQQITYPYQQAWVYESHWESGDCTCSVWGQSNSRRIYNSNSNWYPGGNGSASSDGNYYPEYYGCNDVGCSGSTNRIGCGGAVGNCRCTDPGHDRYYVSQTCLGSCVSTDPTTGACTARREYDCSYWVEAKNNSYSCSGYTNKGYNVRYPIRFRDYGNRTSIASVNIPYNFRTADTSSINAGSTIYAGESVSSAFTASILPVMNSSIKSTDSAYATVYPGDIKIEQFIIGPDSAAPAQTKGVLPIGNGTMCNYFGGTQCGTIAVTNQDSNWLNSQGRYNGWTWSMSATYNVPNNVDIGSKYCVAIGMTIASSHSNADAQTVSGWHSFNGNWRVSLSCRTIAKKPNFQAWNANLYSSAGIRTTSASKYEGATLGTNSPADRVFGSWEEYLAISNGEIVGLASGAALGYEGSTMRITGGHAVTGNYCDLSHMTISNQYCSSGYGGDAKVNLSNALINRLYSRYAPLGLDTNSTGDINNTAPSILANSTGARTSEYIKTSGDGFINSTIVRGDNSPVLVIYVPGTLTINSNICYGAGTCTSNDGNLVLGSRNSQRFSDMSSLPQIIIIAGQIRISENVIQIDAWLVGTLINTCYQFNVGVSSSDTCSKNLIVNGPTIATSIALNRTAGAYTRSTFGQNDRPGAENNLTDDGSITPAEIFNYRPDTILWGYQQSQNFSQATVTYSRELSPRY